MNITPYHIPQGGCTGHIDNITADEIALIIGFADNVSDKDDPYKVKYSWAFIVDDKDGGTVCGIWDYKGSHLYNSFSTCGPHFIFRELFGARYIPGY